MGVRLVRYNNGITTGSGGSGKGTFDHNELINRDLVNQHPISAITGLQESLDGLQALIDSLVKNYEDSRSIHFDVDNSTKTLTANVKLFASEDNAIQEKVTGLFVDKYPEIETEDTASIHLYTEGAGETLETMYNGGNVFSHNGGTNNIASDAEANAWYFDKDLGSFVQPKNTTTFTGFVSNIKYRTYIHRATLRSSDSDNDANGLVIAYVKDENGNPHTLSCIINKGGESHAGSWHYALVYNRELAGEQVIQTGTMSNGHSGSGWNNSFITMEVSKAANAIECSISDWNSLDINLKTVISVDLNDYTWGHYFTGRVQYGYCNQSQANSYFTDIYFSGKGPLKATAIISPDEGNALEVRENGLYCSGGGTSTGGNANSNILNIQQTAHNLLVGDVVYLKSDGKYAKAFGEDSERIEVVGIITEVVDADNFVITVSGEFQTTGYDGYPNGTVLYLSDKTTGALTDNPMSYIKPIAIKISSGILINIQRANEYGFEGSILYYTTDEVIDAIEDLW
jgi:hypothetical protein